MEYISKQDVLDKLNYISANIIEAEIKENESVVQHSISYKNLFYFMQCMEECIKNMLSIEINITEENQIHMAPLIKNQNNIRF